MACCDDCEKTGGTCGDAKKKAPGAAWSVGRTALVHVGGRVGAEAPANTPPEALAWGEEQFRQGVTYGWIGGSALVIALWGGLYLMRGR